AALPRRAIRGRFFDAVALVFIRKRWQSLQAHRLLEWGFFRQRLEEEFMNDTQNNLTSRRDFLKTSSTVTAATAFAGPFVLTSRSATLSPGEAIQIALVGCGGRGTGAAGQALGVKNGGARLVAMADVFEDRLNSSYELLQKQGKESQLDVPNERKF